MSTLESRLGEEHSIVGDNTDWVSVEMSKTSDESLSIVFFEFMETTVVQDSAQDSIHVELLLVVDWNDTIEILCWEEWSSWLLAGPGVLCIGIIVDSQILDD